MAGGIKGITVKIGGDTTELGKSLTEATTKSKSLQNELKNVDKLLKFNPSNVTLLKQKSDLLKESISQTKDKLKDLKDVQEQVDSGKIKMSEEEYRNLEREIASTENQLKKLKDSQKEFGSVAKQVCEEVGAKFKEVGGKVEDVGKTIAPASLAVAGLGATAVKVTADFDASMSNVSAISGATGADLEALRDKAKEMGETTKFSASESADAMGYMAMAGWKTQDMIDGISGVMNLASASGEDLAKTSDIVTDALTAFGLSAKDSDHFADILASTSSNANTNVSLLGETFKYVAPLCGSMGYSAEDASLAIGLMANAGIKGSQAGTTLKNAIANMVKPTDKQVAIMDRLGISLTDASGNMLPLRAILDQLRTSFGECDADAQAYYATTLFGKESMAGMLAIVNASDSDYQKLAGAIDNCDGSAKNMADTMNDNLNGQITLLKSALEGLAISIGETLMPYIRGFVDILQGVVDKLNSMTPAQQQMVIIIGVIIATIGPLLIIIGKVITAVGTIIQVVGMVATPVGAVIAIIGLLVGAFLYLWNTSESFRNFWIGLWDGIKATVSGAVEGIKGFFNGLKDAVGTVKDKFGELKDGVEEKVTGIKEGVSQKFDEIKTKMSDAMGEAKEYVQGKLDNIQQAYDSNGGGIRGIVSATMEGVKGYYSTGYDAINTLTGGKLGEVLSKFKDKMGNVKDTVSQRLTDVKGLFTSKLGEAHSTASTILGNIKNKFEEKMNGARDAVKSAIDRIKSFFKFSWSLPPIKLPHISISGSFSLNPPSAPHFSIDWYKKAMSGMLFTGPTVLPTLGGLKGFGEAGNELVIGEEKLLNTFTEAVNRGNNNGAVVEKLQAIENKLNTLKVVLDSGELVGGLVDPMDRALGDKYDLAVRGW